jgi:hypothetical protein
VDALRAIASSIDQLVVSLKQGTHKTLPIEASRQFMAVQTAAAGARVELEKRFPELKGKPSQGTARRDEVTEEPVRAWVRDVHRTLSDLEARIRKGYLNQEDPIALRNAIIGGGSESSPNALNALSAIMAASEVSNFDVRRPCNARALGIRADLSKLPLLTISA